MYHQPVMLKEAVDALHVQPNGIYIDVTYGGGGHTKAILPLLKTGKVYAFDQDEDAEKQLVVHPNLVFTRANFQYVEQYMNMYQAGLADGLLADLGISSYQIDEPGRGFSTRWEGPLDMRMNTSAEQTAADVVNYYSEADLHKILGMYGELKNAKTLATTIVKARSKQKISTTDELKRVITHLAPRGKEFKYQAQVFQALRIEVNRELEVLERLLNQCLSVLKPGGRLVVLSYHSLEDRMVKHFMQTGNVAGVAHKDLYGNLIRPFEPLLRKPLEASPEEVAQNPRARSAKLRVAQRTGLKN